MRILVIGQFYLEAFATHIAETFSVMGHDVTQFEVNVKRFTSLTQSNQYLDKISLLFSAIYKKSPAYERRLRTKLQSCFKKRKFDLILVCYDFLTPGLVEFIKQMNNAPVCLWFPDAVSNFGKAMFINAKFDYYFFKDPYIVKVLRSDIGLQNVFYLPECCNPVHHKKVELSEQDHITYGCDIATAGNLHAMRVQFFTHLKDYHVKIWGHRPPVWMDTREISSLIMNHYVGNLEKSKAFQGASILVNNLYPPEIYGVNVRTFEMAATGGFQLINYRPGIKQLFELDKEIVAFQNIDDLKEKIDYYLKKDDLRAFIGERSRQRTLREHTYSLRLQLMLDTVFGDKAGFPMLMEYH